MVDRSVLLLTYTGRRSGRVFTLPVQYAREGATITVVPGRPGEKTWWRNFLDVPRPVEVQIGRRTIYGKAQVYREGLEFSHGIEAYMRRFPRAAAKGPISLLLRIELEA
jgi:deazaflavin-dependent oxidoreductase (nitroreductase family)